MMEQRPHPGRVVADPGQALDHGGDAVESPQLPDKAVSGGALQQGLLDLGELGVGELRAGTGRAAAAQAVDSLGLPALIPEVDALAGDAELAGDLGLADAGGEQLGGTQPTGLEAFALSLCGRTASNGWHGADPDRHGSAASTQARQINTQNPLRTCE
jgi:hypothetical protein